MKKRIKYFTKFDNSMNKERILAKLMRYNYNIINNMLLNNPQKAKELEIERDEFYAKALLRAEEYLKYCKAVLKQTLTENFELRKEQLSENKENIKENKLIIKFYKHQYKYYKYDFVNLLDASVNCVKHGKVVPFANLDENLRENITFENCFDMIINLKNFSLLGYTVANLNYRCKLIRHNMPIFMTKAECELYEKTVKKHFCELSRFPSVTDMAPISIFYNKQELIEKELYESVFPEFGLKYEDRESETMPVYIMKFNDMYDD